MYNETQIIPDDAYIYALNAVNSSESGTASEIISEIGNTAVYNLPNYELLGSIEAKDGSVYLFYQGAFFKIIKYKDIFTEVLSTSCFSYSNPIKGEIRI